MPARRAFAHFGVITLRLTAVVPIITRCWLLLRLFDVNRGWLDDDLLRIVGIVSVGWR